MNNDINTIRFISLFFTLKVQKDVHCKVPDQKIAPLCMMTKKADYSMLWQFSERMSMDRRLPAGNQIKFSYRRTGNNDKTQIAFILKLFATPESFWHE
ncbi:MAG: hypothetical protein U5L09_20555 [Bacteroidales bacterium]|nr:hypothetical protein [Bacteroidales bacterium]